MKKQVFHDAASGVLRPLILSTLFTHLCTKYLRTTLNLLSHRPSVMDQSGSRGALVLLYCTLLGATIGSLFNFRKLI